MSLAMISNGESLALGDIPRLTPDGLVETTSRELKRGARLCAWFGVPEGEKTRLVAVLAYDADNGLAVLSSGAFAGRYPSLTLHHAQAHLFEREVWEQHGLEPEGHPWLKSVRRIDALAPANAEFFRIQGREIHEVAVGPVHAGIIEPGHFRFQCAGEEVLHLEIALGYQHRGIEQALVGGPTPATLSQMEVVAGDSTLAHATAHAMVMEALSGDEAPLRAQWLRAIGLELERLANHVGDLGALAHDVAFLPTSAACGKLRGDFLNLTALVCGNRFGRRWVRPGGSHPAMDLDAGRCELMLSRLTTALEDTERAVGWLWDAASVGDRFENVGRVSSGQALEIGLVGPAARACGLVRDVRYDHPAGWHRFGQVPVVVWPGGDVFARARVRSLEIQRSGQYLREQLLSAPEGEIHARVPMVGSERLAIALVEGWRGEVCHVALTDASGRYAAYKIVDPSFHNWSGLALAMRGAAISDFPICNKSFNLSYCGFDL